MAEMFDIGLCTIVQGDNLETLRLMPDRSIQCGVTSPPYYGLRDYGMDGQMGLEKTPQEYVDRMVVLFREFRRVLRDDGTLWLNLGDSYAGHGGQSPQQGAIFSDRKRGQENSQLSGRCAPSGVIKTKDLIGIPWRVAFALQADGWYLRQDIIWDKPNPMPESTTDRCTKAHEYIFLLTKSAKYYYDHEGIKEPVAAATVVRMSQPNLDNQQGSDRVPGKPNGPMKAVLSKSGNKERKPRSNADVLNIGAQSGSIPWEGSTRNKRSVWRITTKPFKGAHFATFPPDLIEPCILAGTSAAGRCPHCGAPWARVVEKGAPDIEHQRACGGDANGEYDGQSTKDYAVAGAQDASATKARILAGMVGHSTIGWRPVCECYGTPPWPSYPATPKADAAEGEKVAYHAECNLISIEHRRLLALFKPLARHPCVVLDPFGGAGTTGLVSARHKRMSILLELNPEYIALSVKRLTLDLEKEAA